MRRSDHVAEQIAQVDRDLAELDDQVEAGEIDEATAERLRSAYRAERAVLERKLDDLGEIEVGEADTVSADDGGEEAPAPVRKGRSRGRAVAGTVIVAVAAVVVAVVAIFSLQDQSSTAGPAGAPPATLRENPGGADGMAGMSGMGEVSLDDLEAAVAANPDVVGMRRALAERYLQEGDVEKALEHYRVVMEREPDDPDVLVRVGWLMSISGDAEGSEPLFVKAIDIDPDFPQAYWFLANVRFDLDRKSEAVAPLESLLAFTDIPDEVRAEATKMLEEARS